MVRTSRDERDLPAWRRGEIGRVAACANASSAAPSATLSFRDIICEDITRGGILTLRLAIMARHRSAYTNDAHPHDTSITLYPLCPSVVTT